jgi:hypothetical protein
MNDTLLIWANLVIACATVVAAIAEIASARYARKAVNDQQTNFEKQLAEYKLALLAETTLKFEERFNDPHFKRVRSRAALALRNNSNEEDAEDVFDFFDTLWLFIDLGALTERIAYSVFFHWINLYWKAGKHHIGSKQQDTASVWQGFSSLYNKVVEIERQNNADSEDLKMSELRLGKQLQDEIDVADIT